MRLKVKEIKVLLIAGLLLGALLISASPVSAANIYASGKTTITDSTKTHYALIFNIPYSDFSFRSVYVVKGVNIIALGLSYPHISAQNWDRQSYASGTKSILLVSERYTWARPNYANEIYIYTAKPYGGGGGGSW